MIEAIAIFCAVGLSYTSYKIGLKEGAEKMLEHLQQGRIIDIDDEGTITPRIL